MADDEAITDGTTRRPPQEIVATRRHAHWGTDVAGHGLTVLTLVGHTAPVFARTALGDGLGLPVYGTVVLAQQRGVLVRRYSVAHGWAADGAIRQAHAATVAAIMSGTLPLDGRHVGPCGEYADALLAALNSVLARARAHGPHRRRVQRSCSKCSNRWVMARDRRPGGAYSWGWSR